MGDQIEKVVCFRINDRYSMNLSIDQSDNSSEETKEKHDQMSFVRLATVLPIHGAELNEVRVIFLIGLFQKILFPFKNGRTFQRLYTILKFDVR